MIHQIDSKNEWLLLSASFTAKLGLVFDLTMERAQVLLKNSNGDFKNSPLFKRLTCFMCHSVEILNVFNTLTLNRFSGKQKPFLKNQSIYYFLVESTKFKNASFRCKTAIPETNVKTNRMLSIKWTYHKEQSFASNYFFFKFYFSLRTSYKKLIWCTKDPNAHICT